MSAPGLLPATEESGDRWQGSGETEKSPTNMALRPSADSSYFGRLNSSACGGSANTAASRKRALMAAPISRNGKGAGGELLKSINAAHGGRGELC